MSTKKIWSKNFHSRKFLVVISSFVLIVLVGLGCGAWIMSEEKEVVLTINNHEVVVNTYANTLSDLLKQEGIELDDVVDSSMDLHAALSDGQKVDMAIALDCKVFVDDESIDLTVVAENVAEVISNAGIKLGENDVVEPALDAPVTAGMVIDIHRVTIKEEIRETKLAYSVETRKDSTIVSGDKLVIQAGQAGRQTDTYRVTYRDGELYDEELLSTEVTDPVTEIVAVGTGCSVLPAMEDEEKNSESESTATFSTVPNGRTCVKVLTCKATAYHEPEGSLTKSGTLSRVGAIAVDPSVIPLGTELYVEGYGYCVAEDTGGLIKGNRIDIYLDSESECVEWGVRDVSVYILK